MSRPTLAQRLWPRLAETPAGCLEWQGSRDRDGYGRIRVNGKRKRAHRIAWQLHHDQLLTPDVLIRHQCDNPPCCNPAHLVTGSVVQNVGDRNTRGRQASGAHNGRSKYDDQVIADLLAAIRDGMGQREAARRFGISRTYVHNLANGRARRAVA